METINNSKIPTGVKVLGITGLAYVVAFAFQYGYLKHFGISYRAIEIDPIMLIISIGGISFVLYALDSLAVPFRIMHNGIKTNEPIDRYKRAVLRLTILGLFIALALFGIGSPPIVYVLCLFLVLFYLMEPIVYLRRNVGIKRAIKKMYKRRDAQLAAERAESYGDKYNSVVSVVVGLVFIAIFSGKLHAMSTSSAYVVSEHGNVVTVLIQKNGNTLVTKDFNKITNEIEPGFELHILEGSLKLRDRVKIQ